MNCMIPVDAAAELRKEATRPENSHMKRLDVVAGETQRKHRKTRRTPASWVLTVTMPGGLTLLDVHIGGPGTAADP